MFDFARYFCEEKIDELTKNAAITILFKRDPIVRDFFLQI